MIGRGPSRRKCGIFPRARASSPVTPDAEDPEALARGLLDDEPVRLLLVTVEIDRPPELRIASANIEGRPSPRRIREVKAPFPQAARTSPTDIQDAGAFGISTDYGFEVVALAAALRALRGRVFTYFFRRRLTPG